MSSLENQYVLGMTIKSKMCVLHITTIHISVLLIICYLIFNGKLDLTKMLIKIFDYNTNTPN